MKIKKNGKVIRLTESDVKRIVKRVLTENTIDQNGITIGNITIYEGDVYDMPYVNSEPGSDSLSINVNVRDNIKNYESLLKNTLGYNPYEYGAQYDDYSEVMDKTSPHMEDLMSMSNLKCTWLSGGEPEAFVPGIRLFFTKKRDSIFLTKVESYGSTARCPYKCSPDKSEIDECTNI